MCSRLGRVPLGLVAIALEAPFEPVPYCLFRPAVGPLALSRTHAPRPWVVLLRAGPSFGTCEDREVGLRSSLTRIDHAPPAKRADQHSRKYGIMTLGKEPL